MGIEDLLPLVLRQLARDRPRPTERILDAREPLDEPRAPLEQVRELVDRQLPR
jgi:hypothetical protein